MKKVLVIITAAVLLALAGWLPVESGFITTAFAASDIQTVDSKTRIGVSTKTQTNDAADDQCYVKTEPYEAASTVKIVAKNKAIYLSGAVKNKYGNTWYKTTDGYYIWSGDLNVYEYAHMLYLSATFKTTESCNTRVAPYSKAAKGASKSSGATVTVTRFVTNSYGNIWAQLTDGSFLCLYDKDANTVELTFKALGKQPTISNATSPSGKLTKGESFSIAGTIKASAPMLAVTAHVIDRETGKEATGANTPVSARPSATATSVKLNSSINGVNINSDMDFSGLPGGWYNYYVDVQFGIEYNGKFLKFGSPVKVVSSDFEVTGAVMTEVDKTERIGISIKKKTGDAEDDQCYIKRAPYEISDTAMVMAKGDLINIVGAVKNKHGNTWYKTAEGYYVYSGDVDAYGFNTIFAIKAEFVNEELRYTHVAPYVDAPSIDLITKDTFVTATRFVKNTKYGNIWAQLSDGSWLCFYDRDTGENKLTYHSMSMPTVSNAFSPSNTIQQGQDVAIKGDIKAYAPMLSVTARIVSRTTGKDAAAGGTPAVAKPAMSAAIAKLNTSINGVNLDNALLFSKLPGGKYTYRIEVQHGFAYDGKTFKFGKPVEVITSDFAVKASALTITQQPQNVSVPLNSKATATVKAEGAGLTYTWYVKSAGSSKYTKSSITSSTYSVTMTSARNGTQIYCVVTDQYGNQVKSNTVTLSRAATALKITQQPQSTSAATGNTVKVTVKASGDGLKYTWYVKSVGTSKFTKSAITTSSYSVKMTDARNGNRIYCVVSDKYGNKVTSDTVTISKAAAAVQITSQPKNVAADIGEKVAVTVKASGDGLKYTWYVKSVGSSKFTKSSITSSTYSVTMRADRNGNQVYCVVTDQYGNKATSNTVTLSKKVETLQILAQPKNASAKLGEKAKSTVEAVGDGLTYTWYIWKNGENGFACKQSGIRGATYTAVMTNQLNGMQGYCFITDKYGNSAKTDTVTFSIN